VTTAAGSRGGLRFGEGEEARITPGEAGQAEIWSRGFLPLRARVEARHHARPTFPGTAVVLGEVTFEVLSETDVPKRGAVVYRLRAWPEGEVVRDRVVYDSSFVRRALVERERARLRSRVAPFRWLLYPVVGLLPEEQQEQASDRLGLYSPTATLVSGIAESLVWLWALARIIAVSEPGRAVSLLLALPAGLVFVLPGLGRAFSALALRETGGSPVVVWAFALAHGLGAWRRRHDAGFTPLTRAAFWGRLQRPDTIERTAEGPLEYRSLLAHLSWTGSRRLQSAGDFWSVTPLAPRFDRGRLMYAYRLEPVGPAPPDGGPAPQPVAATAYADEVVSSVRREWDALHQAFPWLACLLGAEVQARAFAHRGGARAARRATLATAAGSALLAFYLLSFLPGGPAADPLAPFVAAGAFALLVDAARRVVVTRAGRYAPSLWRAVLPSDTLRPERVAYRAHREAERRTLETLLQACGR
jgi:hypothetical protein